MMIMIKRAELNRVDETHSIFKHPFIGKKHDYLSA